jgi:tetratricopeptide (TPR) repeat protein
VIRFSKPEILKKILRSALGLCIFVVGSFLLTEGVFAQTQVIKLVPTPHTQAMQFIKENKKQEALAYINEYLGKNPFDPQMLFWKAKLLRESALAKDQEEGLGIYISLSENNPELAEPHNNIGVIYAAQGDYLKAVDYFVLALRANPGYALANENLADVYVQMAVEQYKKAIVNDPGNKTATIKLQKISPNLSNPIKK